MPSKKVSMRASMANQTSHFGIMGGLYNRKISGRSSTNRVTSRLKIPAGADAGLRYMKLHNLLSRNPLGSGGVGRMFNIRPRGSGLGSHLGNVKPTTDNLGDEDNLGDSLGDSLGDDNNQLTQPNTGWWPQYTVDGAPDGCIALVKSNCPGVTVDVDTIKNIMCNGSGCGPDSNFPYAQSWFYYNCARKTVATGSCPNSLKKGDKISQYCGVGGAKCGGSGDVSCCGDQICYTPTGQTQSYCWRATCTEPNSCKDTNTCPPNVASEIKNYCESRCCMSGTVVVPCPICKHVGDVVKGDISLAYGVVDGKCTCCNSAGGAAACSAPAACYSSFDDLSEAGLCETLNADEPRCCSKKCSSTTKNKCTNTCEPGIPDSCNGYGGCCGEMKCTSNAGAGEPRGTCCMKSDGKCQQDTDCCEGTVCYSDKCKACKHTDYPCNSGDTCCDPSALCAIPTGKTEGTCKKCINTDDHCNSDDTCCDPSALCDPSKKKCVLCQKGVCKNYGVKGCIFSNSSAPEVQFCCFDGEGNNGTGCNDVGGDAKNKICVHKYPPGTFGPVVLCGNDNQPYYGC